VFHSMDSLANSRCPMSWISVSVPMAEQSHWNFLLQRQEIASSREYRQRSECSTIFSRASLRCRNLSQAISIDGRRSSADSR
jgi:hypothetical protein